MMGVATVSPGGAAQVWYVQQGGILSEVVSQKRWSFRHSLELAGALFRAGRDFDLLPLSSMTHMTLDPVVTERLYSRIADFFQAHLGKPAR